MKELVLNTYNFDGTLKKEYKCNGFELTFGTVRELSEIFDIVEKIPNYTNVDVVRVMIAKGDFLPHLLGMMFKIPMEEMDNVKYQDVINVLGELIKYSTEIMQMAKN